MMAELLSAVYLVPDDWLRTQRRALGKRVVSAALHASGYSLYSGAGSLGVFATIVEQQSLEDDHIIPPHQGTPILYLWLQNRTARARTETDWKRD